ncbi:MAG TPA: IS110 family transposase [Terriglobia bacterium]|nr:IS110 family transposase [Terriglobia bacterium]
MYYIGLDVHKKTISYCVKDASGQVHQEGKIGATRVELDCWMKTLPQPWTVAMEATIFTGWIYDHLLPHAEQVKVAHPLMLRAIAAAKKKNDRIDAGKIADCLRCDFLPECHMAPTAIRDRRRTLRYRHLLVRQMVQMKNRISGLLLETGVSHNKQRLHKVRYFRELLTSEEIHESIRPLLRLSRETIVRLQKTEYALVSSLQRDPLLAERVRRLRTVPGVGPITALTWALEMGEVSRFRSIKHAISYCGLCGDEKSSADKVIRTRLSKQRNKHIQQVLVEAAKLAPRRDYQLARVYETERQKGNANRATLAVARKMVAYLLAVDRGQRDFVPFPDPRSAAARECCLLGEQQQDPTARRLPGPAGGPLSDGDHLRRLPSNCFGTGSEHKLNLL